MFASRDYRDLESAVTEAIKAHTGYQSPPLGTVYSLCMMAARERAHDEKPREIESGETIPVHLLHDLVKRLKGSMHVEGQHGRARVDDFPVDAGAEP